MKARFRTLRFYLLLCICLCCWVKAADAQTAMNTRHSELRDILNAQRATELELSATCDSYTVTAKMKRNIVRAAIEIEVCLSICDNGINKRVWSRSINGGAKEWNANKLFVSKFGTVVILTSSGGLTFVNTDGLIRFQIGDFLQQKRKQPICECTHVSLWHPADLIFFYNKDSQDVLRYRGWPFLGHDIDATTGATSPSPEVDQFDKIEISKILAETRKNGFRERSTDNVVFWAGQLGLRTAVPDLLAIKDGLQTEEKDSSVADSSELTWPSCQQTTDALNYLNWALLVLNSNPATLPRDAGNRDRMMGYRSLEPGQTSADVLHAMGCPDFISEEGWIYELVSDDSSTVCVNISEGKIQQLHFIRPSILRSEKFVRELLCGGLFLNTQ